MKQGALIGTIGPWGGIATVMLTAAQKQEASDRVTGAPFYDATGKKIGTLGNLQWSMEGVTISVFAESGK